MIVIELGLYYFAGSTYSNTSLANMVLNPSTIPSNVLYLAIVAAITLMVATQIIPGNFFQINIYGVYAGIITFAITFVASAINLSTFMNSELTAVFGPGGTDVSTFITAIVATPIIIFYIMACIEWVRFNN